LTALNVRDGVGLSARRWFEDNVRRKIRNCGKCIILE
jgi:hypothetical protein